MAISYHVSFIISLLLVLTNHPLLIQSLPNQPNLEFDNPNPPPPIPSPNTHHTNSTNPPDIAVIAGILTTIFSLTFLILLYMKHCKKPENYSTTYTGQALSRPSRVNSGLNRKLILSLPTFRFSSLKGQKDGLECAVCLSVFEPNEVLRLLPKCKHAFHVECVDTWLDAHSTCPLCRYRVDPEDALLIDYYTSNQTTPRNSNKGNDIVTNPRISGRHSYACERANTNPSPVFPGRSSLDSFKSRMKPMRKDGILPTKAEKVHKVDHRIIVGEEGEERRRWSDVEAQRSEFLYLETEMILEQGSGSRVISGRSVSDIVGLSRCMEVNNTNNNGERDEEKAVKRWLGWISQSQQVIKNKNTAVVGNAAALKLARESFAAQTGHTRLESELVGPVEKGSDIL